MTLLNEEAAHYKTTDTGISKNKNGVNTETGLCGRQHDLVYPYNVAVSRIISDVFFATDKP